MSRSEEKSPVIVRASLQVNGGRGVFCNQDLKENDYVCDYDGYLKTAGRPASKTEQDYALGCIIGHPEPRNASGVAQLVNDAAIIDIDGHDPRQSIPEQLQWFGRKLCQYALKSASNANVQPRNRSHPKEFIAIRDISAGEELYFDYGLDYWMTKLFHSAQVTDELAYIITLWRVLIHTTILGFDPMVPRTMLRMTEDLKLACWAESVVLILTMVSMESKISGLQQKVPFKICIDQRKRGLEIKLHPLM